MSTEQELFQMRKHAAIKEVIDKQRIFMAEQAAEPILSLVRAATNDEELENALRLA
ncbi:MAG: hypothetical protein ACC707_16300 [Thiohalomonadales bacterium]